MKPNPPGERLRLLFEQMAQAHERRTGKSGDKSGAKAEIARKTGLPEGHVSQLMSGAKRAGPGTIERVRARLRLREEFFYNSKLQDPDHTRFFESATPTHNGHPPLVAAPPSPPLDLGSAAEIYAELNITKREMRTLASISHTLRDRETVVAALEAMRSAWRTGADDELATDAAAEVIDNKNAAKDAADLLRNYPASDPPPTSGRTPDRRRSRG